MTNVIKFPTKEPFKYEKLVNWSDEHKSYIHSFIWINKGSETGLSSFSIRQNSLTDSEIEQKFNELVDKGIVKPYNQEEEKDKDD